MNKLIASVDLGSNTFQVLIAEISENNILNRVEKSFAVKLYYDQDNPVLISEKAINRAQIAVQEIIQLLKKYPINGLQVVATAAFRDLENGIKLAHILKKKFEKVITENFSFEIINGNREAELIGIAQEFNNLSISLPHLIMDIGGGSVECIFVNQSKIIWTRSIPIGVAKLVRDFSITFEEPIFKNQRIESLNQFLNEKLDFLNDLLKKYAEINFIGVSGAFETNAQLLGKDTRELHAEFSVEEFENLHHKLQKTNREERNSNTLIPEIRKDMLLIANVIIDNFIRKYQSKISKITYSGYDLKFGGLQAYLRQF